MFFEKINGLMTEDVDLTLTIRKREGVLVVSSLPKVNGLKDDAQNLMAPFTVSGTTAELDAGFFMALQQPVQRATGLLTNMRQHEQLLQNAQKNSKGGKEQAVKATKVVDEKQQKYEKHLARGEELEKEGNFSDALTQYMQARLHATEEVQKTVDDKIRNVKMRMSEQSLFDLPPVQAPVVVQPSSQAAEPATISAMPSPMPEPAMVQATEQTPAAVSAAPVVVQANEPAPEMEIPLFAPEPAAQPMTSSAQPIPSAAQSTPQQTQQSPAVSEPTYTPVPIGNSDPATQTPQAQQCLSPGPMPSWMNYSNGLDGEGLPY